MERTISTSSQRLANLLSRPLPLSAPRKTPNDQPSTQRNEMDPAPTTTTATDTHAPAKPGDLKALAARLRERKASFAKSMADTETKLDEAMQRAEQFVQSHAAEVDDFISEINQLTNGGPA